MDLLSRIKKEMSEGIVRALLEDAGYRVVDTGIEKVLREISALSKEDYLKLEFPQAMRVLPDLTVMTRDEKEKFLVEVKYREKWSNEIFDQLKEQLKHMEEIVLVFVNANPPPDLKRFAGPSRYLRSCKIRHENGTTRVEIRTLPSKVITFVDVKDLPRGDNLWWSMLPLQIQFPKIKEKATEKNLYKAVEAIIGILN